MKQLTKDKLHFLTFILLLFVAGFTVGVWTGVAIAKNDNLKNFGHYYGTTKVEA